MSLEFLQANLHQPKICPNPIFVMGTPRSGTHGLAYALAQHTNLWTHGESEVLFEMFKDIPFADIFQSFRVRPTPTWATMYDVDSPEFLGFLGIGINALFTSRNPSKRWIEKTPRYVAIANMLSVMFPGAYFLHMLRDGRRVVHSMIHFMDRFNASQKAKMKKLGLVPAWRTDFREACKFWRRLVKVGLAFAAGHPDRCLTVVNEELVTDPRGGFAKVCRFIGEPFEERPVAFFQSNRIMSSFSQPKEGGSTNFAKPLSQWTMEDAKAFVEPVPYQLTEPWAEWTAEQKAIFAEEAGALMIQCNFASEDEMRSWGEVAEVGDDPAAVWAGFQLPPSPPPSPLVGEIDEVVSAALTPDATVLVISQGDDDLLDLKVRAAWHFPRTETGEHAGDFPLDGAATLDHLEALRAKGAEFLLVPRPAFVWLDQARDFRRHLADRYDRYWKDERCIIYRLAQPSAGATAISPMNRSREPGRRHSEPEAAVAVDHPGGQGNGTARPAGMPGNRAAEDRPTPGGSVSLEPEAKQRGQHVEQLQKLIWGLRARWGNVFGPEVGNVASILSSNFGSLSPEKQEARCRETHAALGQMKDHWESHVRQLARETVSASDPSRQKPAYPFHVSRLVQLSDSSPVFVLGAPRSGTTAMGKALRTGADLFGWDEGHVFPRLPFLLSANVKAWEEQLQFNKQEQNESCALGNFDIYQVLNQVIRAYDQFYAEAAARAGKTRWVDKTPTVEALLAVPLLNHLYPKARFVFMHRHPVKRVLSRLRRPDSLPGSVEATTMNWLIAMNTWTEVKHVLRPDSYLEVRQPDLSLRSSEVASDVGRLLDLADAQVEGLRDYWATERPEATQSSADAEDVCLEDVDWPEAVKGWVHQVLDPTAQVWGYRLTRA
jgi:hypothetical protein